MNSYQLEAILSNDKYARTYFRGVKARDQFVKETLMSPACYVVNTDKSNQPGAHWLAIWIDSNDAVVYFDSYGLPPFYLDVSSKLLSYSSDLNHNQHLLQSETTVVCGHYCVLFLLMRARGCSFEKTIDVFTPSLPAEIRDHLVNEFVADRFGEILKLYDNTYNKTQSIHISKARNQCLFKN